jgi:Xaa-Pro aminopeptidase
MQYHIVKEGFTVGKYFNMVISIVVMLICIECKQVHEIPVVTHRDDGSIELGDGRIIPPMPELLGVRAQYYLRMDWLKKKHEQLLPMMREHGIGMWIIPEGTFDRDPLTHYVAPTRSFSHGVTHIFVDGGDEGLKRYSTYAHPTIDYTEFFEILPEDYSVELQKIYGLYKPKIIGLAYGGGRGHNSSLTYDAYQYIAKALGPEGQNCFVPAVNLIEEYVDTRLPEELEEYRKLVQATVILAQRAFSNEVITPGVTTTADLKWWFDQQVASWGVGAQPWFTTNTNVQRFNPVTGKIERHTNPSGSDSPDRRPYQRGDLVTIDCGIDYIGFKSDIQRVAYILHEGETDVPAGFKIALQNRNKVAEAYCTEPRPGMRGREAAAAIEKKLEGVDFEYTLGCHSIGYHGHALGPSIRSTKSSYNPQRESESMLRLGSYMAVEGTVTTAIPEWNGQKARISYEDNGVLTENGYEYFAPIQNKWYLIR